MMQLNGAQLMVRLLERQGVRTIAGIPGGAILPFYDALSGSDKIRHVLARHEQGAGFMAQGMARVSGVPQVCIASSGPGATNLVTAIADASLDSIPMVIITGQVPLSMIGTDAFQEVDIYGITVPITKHNFLVRSAQELLEVVPDAFRIAMSGRPGPVLIDVPKDVQNQLITIDEGELPPPAVADPTPPLDMAAIEAAAQMINAAEQPVLYLGGGVVASGAAPLAVQLAEQAGIPRIEFAEAFDSQAMQEATAADFTWVQDLGIAGFPTLLAERDGQLALLTNGYQPLEVLAPLLGRWLERAAHA